MTIREIAKKLGVSPATISIVLNGKKGVSDETRARIKEELDKLGYVSEVRRSKRNASKTKNILIIKYFRDGFLVEENDGFITAILDSISERLSRYHFITTMLTVKCELMESLREINYDPFDGVVVVGTELEKSDYWKLKAINKPMVVIDNPMEGTEYNCVGIDNVECTRIAVEYCKKCGYKSIGHLASSYNTGNFADRIRTFHRSVAEYGFEFDEKWDWSLRPTLLGAYDDARSELSHIKSGDPMPECFFADNDIIAVGAIKALKKKGYKIPDDIAVIGFDDIPYAAVNSPSLTTINIPRKQIGIQTAELLIQLIKSPDIIGVNCILRGKLVVRSSMKESK